MSADPRFCVDLAHTAVRFGDNQLGRALLQPNPDLKERTLDYLAYKETLPLTPIHVTELEIVVKKAT